MENSKTLTKFQWLALAAITWLAPLAWLMEANNSLAEAKLWSLLPALIISLLVGIFLLWLGAKASFFTHLRDGVSLWMQLLRCVLAAYLLLIAGRFLFGAASLWSSWVGAATPLWLFILLLLAIAAYGLHRGTSAVIRWSVLEVAALPVLSLLDTLLLLPKLRWQRLSFMPVVNMAWWEACLIYLALLLAALPVLLWFSPQSSGKERKFALGGWLLSGLYLLLLVLRDALALGRLSTWERFPILRTLRMVELGVGLNRVEYLAILVLMGLILAGVLVLSAAAREMLERVPILKRKGSIILSIAILAAASFL